MWICRSCRPDIACGVSELQTATKKPIVEDVILRNKVVEQTKKDPEAALVWKPGVVAWPSKDDPELKLCMMVVSDASNGGVDEWIPDEEVREPFRSQGGKLVFLGDKEEVETTQESGVHILHFGSHIVRRVCNSTIKAETYQPQTSGVW